MSTLDVLNYFSNGIYSYSNTVVNRSFTFREMAPVTILLKREVEEIPLPLPGEYSVDIGFDFGSNTVSVVSQVMQGKDLIVQATDNLTNTWIEAGSVRYLYDGISTQKVAIAAAIDRIMDYKKQQDPSLMPEELSDLRMGVENGPLFFRSVLRY